MKEKNVKAKAPNKKVLGLTTKIFIALLAGAILGIVLCYLVPDSSFKKDVIVEGILYVIGQGFIRLMKMLVVPLVFCSLVCGSMAIGDTKKLGTVGVRTLAFYLATTALAVCVALGVGNLINPGVGLDMSAIQSSAASVETMEATSLTDTILNLIPDNPINSLASGSMLQVIVFALIVGVILAKMGERAETVANFFSQFNDIMMEMTMMIMSLAPIGVFCLISRTFANIGFSAFIPLAKYMIGVLLALAIQCFGVYPFQEGWCIQEDFFLHDSAWCDHQHGWYFHHAGRGCCFCSAGIWYPLNPDGLCNGYRNSNTCFRRYCRCTECWSCNPDDGIQLCRTSG